MQGVEHDRDARAAMNPQRLFERMASVVVFEHQPLSHRRWQRQKLSDKPFAGSSSGPPRARRRGRRRPASASSPILSSSAAAAFDSVAERSASAGSGRVALRA
jgi:hypothetical protein